MRKLLLIAIITFFVSLFFLLKPKPAESQFTPAGQQTTTYEFTITYFSRRASYSWTVDAKDIAEAKKLAEKMMAKMEGKNWKKSYAGKSTICQKIP